MNTAFILFAILITLVGFSLGALLLQFLTTLYQVKGITFLQRYSSFYPILSLQLFA